MVPMVVPAMMLRMVLYFIPLQMITLQPCSRAKLADRTFNQSELSIQFPAVEDQSEGSIPSQGSTGRPIKGQYSVSS